MSLTDSLKRAVSRLANMRIVRSAVVHLVYPTIVGCIKGEIVADVPSESGVVEELAWKVHSQLVLSVELKQYGENCCPEGLCSTPTTRLRLFEICDREIRDVPGDILEFGVAAGESLQYWAAKCPGRNVYGFDSFEGLPESWWTRQQGAFKAAIPELQRPNVKLVKGLFDDTLPGFISDWQGRAALVHIDCDLFSSTRTTLTHLLPHCFPGTVVLFDEYYNYPVFAEHEWLAWQEAIGMFGLTARCIAFDGRRAAFVINAIASRAQASAQPAHATG